MSVTDATPFERRNRSHLHYAITVLDTALLQGPAVLGRYTNRLEHRRSWLTARLTGPDRPQPAGTRNQRSAVPTTLGTAPAQRRS
jgi:hypothetical protein